MISIPFLYAMTFFASPIPMMNRGILWRKFMPMIASFTINLAAIGHIFLAGYSAKM